jgi:cytochrome b pre-mRNA-processing protein 3
MAGMAKKIREAAPKMTETYAAYGLTEALVKECCKAGDYTVPQVFEPGAEIPTDETGAHVGVGEGWWYESKNDRPHFSSSSD